MRYARHTLVDLTPEARAGLAAVVAERLLPPFRRADIAARAAACLAAHAIPGIACRPTEDMPAGHVQLGLAFPFRDGASRVRALIAVAPDAIAGDRSAYELFSPPLPDTFPFAALLGELLGAAQCCDVRLGAFGSAALHLATGLDYVGPESDLDLLAQAVDPEGLRAFAAAADALGRRYDVRLDIEVELVNGYGVKAREVLSDSKTVLGRGPTDVRLFTRDDAMRAIATTNFPTRAAVASPKSIPTRSVQWN